MSPTLALDVNVMCRRSPLKSRKRLEHKALRGDVEAWNAWTPVGYGSNRVVVTLVWVLALQLQQSLDVAFAWEGRRRLCGIMDGGHHVRVQF